MGFLSCLISQPGFSASPAGPVEHCTLPVNLKLPVTPESKSWTVASLLAFSYRAHLIFTLTEQHWAFQFFGGYTAIIVFCRVLTVTSLLWINCPLLVLLHYILSAQHC